MKNLLTASILLMSFLANADDLSLCKTKSAQFEGKVASVRQSQDSQGKTECYIRLTNLTYYSNNQLCPIDESNLLNHEIKAYSCAVKVNDKINGTIVENDGRLSID